MEKKDLYLLITKKIKNASRLLKSCLFEKERCLNYENIRHEAELLSANFFLIKNNLSQITVTDWNDSLQKTIAIDPLLKPEEIIAQKFKLAKRMKLGLPRLDLRILETQEKLAVLNKQAVEIEKLNSQQEIDAFLIRENLPFKKEIPLDKKSTSPQRPYRTFHTESGLEILVGKNALGNEKITFRLANGSDLWFHIHGLGGSHVVLRTKKNKNPDSESIEDALQLALYYSKGKNKREGEVVMAKINCVARFGLKSQPGKVQISSHKLFFVRASAERLKKIIDRPMKLFF